VRFSKALLQRARRLLCELQDHVRDRVIAARTRDSRGFAKIDAVTAADTIYGVDRISEAAVVGWFERHWPVSWPVELVMEGIADGSTVTFPRGTPVSRTVLKCIVDPIDGTRNFMHDKRSAWILAALAPQRGARTLLADIAVAAMTELPTTRQWRTDQVSAVRGCGRRGICARYLDLRNRRWSPLRLRPSRARDFEQGFASFVRFFPEGKALTARLEEELWKEIHGTRPGAAPVVFDDQYLTTGGQIHEILSGRDRMIGDVRPLVFAKLGLASSLVCHPYDICTSFILEEAGGVVENPAGGPLRARLDTTSPVAWIGYANPALARAVRPILRRLIRKLL